MTPSQYTVRSLLKQQEQKIKDRSKHCDEKRIPLAIDRGIQEEKQRMLGMIEVAQAIQLDITEFRYVYLL
jgi:hypothetical protein